MPRFKKNIIINGTIELKTGLHIGGLKETVEIGGVDNPVITTYKKYGDEIRKVPYIPGSSLKGKIRSLLEIAYAEDIRGEKPQDASGYVKIGNDNYIKYESEKAKLIPKIFGIPGETKVYKENLTRIIFRDAFPTEKTLEEWNRYPDIVGGTEVKPENAINRITSAANPRFFERVPASSEFEFEIVLTIYEGDNEKEMLNLLLDGMKRLENSYIGGFGSRGYGKIRFHIDEVVERDTAYYKGNADEQEVFKGGTLDELLQKYGD